MTPTEMDLLHLRLVQIGKVLEFVIGRSDFKPEPYGLDRPVPLYVVCSDVDEIKKGLNR